MKDLQELTCVVFPLSWEPKDFNRQELTMDSGVTGDLGCFRVG